MASFEYNYQNAFRCNLCSADFCHARAILHKRKYTEYNNLPQSILGVVVKWRHHANVLLLKCRGYLAKILSTLFRLAIHNVFGEWKAKARSLCGKGQLGSKLHDVHITRRTEKIGILRPTIKGNETGHIYMQVQTSKNLINTIQATIKLLKW